MLDFTENMKRIGYYTEQSLKHSQEEKFEACREDLANILIHGNEALQQVEDLLIISQNNVPPIREIIDEEKH